MIKDIIIHSSVIARYIRPEYSFDQIFRLKTFLLEQHTLLFRPIGNGLYPAVQCSSEVAPGGYQNVWVRDNIYIAYAHYINGRLAVAHNVLRTLSSFFFKYKSRFTDIISGAVDPAEPMKRVHVRFDGVRLEEISEKWSHIQNDALGYFVWLFSKMALANALVLENEDLEMLENFMAYFRAIQFWEDEDSGHWEEVRKISASSIGVVAGGLDTLKAVLETNSTLRQNFGSNRIDADIGVVDELRALGKRALKAILPAECLQTDNRKRRLFDSALLFLIYPIGVLGQSEADQIIANVIEHLQGNIGIRRYLGDSYWCADYKDLLPPEQRSKDFSEDMERRDALLREGEEAQWCIFDPIMSVIYGRRFMETRKRQALELQAFYFNRSLAQITEDLKCPEAYYLEKGRYVPNDNRPLLWTQANLWLALRHMEQSVLNATA